MLGWSTCSDSGFLNVWNYINKSQKKLLTLWGNVFVQLCKKNCSSFPQAPFRLWFVFSYITFATLISLYPLWSTDRCPWTTAIQSLDQSSRRSLCKYHFDPTQWRQLRRPLVRINEPQTLQRKGQFSICFGLPSYQGFVSKAVFVVSKAPMLWEQWNLKVNTPTVTCCGETHHPLAHLCFYLKAHGKNHGTQ